MAMSTAHATVQSAYAQPPTARAGSHDSVDAMHSYQRIMHQHTKQQFEMATASSRRRSVQSNGVDRKASLASESSTGSVTSA